MASGSPVFRTRQGLGDPKVLLVRSGRGTRAALGDAATDFHGGCCPPRLDRHLRAVAAARSPRPRGDGAGVASAATFGAEGFRRTFVVKRLRAELSRDSAVVAGLPSTRPSRPQAAPTSSRSSTSAGGDGSHVLAQEYILGEGRITTARWNGPTPPPRSLTHPLRGGGDAAGLEYAHRKASDSGG